MLEASLVLTREDSDSDSEQKQHSRSNNSKSSPKLPDTEPTTETSDFDSISTTSASYVVSHSDMESLSLDDHQLDLLMNKSDLSDLDQIDAKTITGSGSSDEDSPRLADGNVGSMESKPFTQNEWRPSIKHTTVTLTRGCLKVHG